MIFRKTISVFVILTFMLSNVAFAVPDKSNDTRRTAHDAQTITPDTIVIPRDFGLIKSKWNGTSDKLIIHIQDAHCNYEAQTNIAKILEGLVKNYSVGLVSVEGADGYIDTAWFKAFPDDEVRKEVADYFMKKGEITGPEFLSITTDLPFKLFGAETRSYYIDNLNAFTSSYSLKSETEKYFNSIKSVLNRLKSIIYTEELKTFDARIQDYESKKLQFNDYVRFLQGLGEHHKINLRSYDNFFRLVSVLIYEKKIDFNVTDKERSALIDELSKAIAKEQLQQVVGQSISFKSGRISSAEYYAYLKNLSAANGIDLAKKYPNLYNYIIYNAVYSKIENEKLFSDIKKVETALKDKMFANDDQRMLDKLSHHIDILLGLVNIKLMNGDFDYYLDNKKEFTSEYFEGFIKKKTVQYGLAYDINPPADAITQSIPKLEDFYSIAIRRDKALVDNTLSAMKSQKKSLAVLVTGGFHSDGITKLLEKEGVSYMVVCPSITKDVPSPYIEILTNQRTPLENILVGTAHAKENMLAAPLRTQLTVNENVLKDIAAKLESGAASDLKLAIGKFKGDWVEITVLGLDKGPTGVGAVKIDGYIRNLREGTGSAIDDIVAQLKEQLDQRCRKLGLSTKQKRELNGLLDETVSSQDFKSLTSDFEAEFNKRLAAKSARRSPGEYAVSASGESRGSLQTPEAILAALDRAKRDGSLTPNQAFDIRSPISTYLQFKSDVDNNRPNVSNMTRAYREKMLEELWDECYAAMSRARELLSSAQRSPGENAVAGAQSGPRKLTNAQNTAYNEILRQSFADGTWREVSARQIGIHDPEFKDFKFIVHYGLEARIERYNKEHGTNIPTDRVHPGRGGDLYDHGKLQAHISSYRFDSLLKGGDLQVLRTIARHELAHIQISNGEKNTEAYIMRQKYPRKNEEDVVDLYVSGANTRTPVSGSLSVREKLTSIDERRAADKTYKAIEALITDTEYGTAARDIYINLMKEGRENEARDYAVKAYTRRQNADRMRNAFKADPYEGYDIVVITNSTEDESAVRQKELDEAFKNIKTESGKPVIAISITDKSYGGQIIGQINTERLVMKELRKRGLKENEISRMSMVTFHNGGKGERFSPGSQAFDLSRAKQPVGGEIKNKEGLAMDLTLMLDVIANMLRFAKSSPDRSARGGIRRDVIWANQAVLGTIPLEKVGRSNFAIDKLVVAINWGKAEGALMKDLFDYGTALVDKKTGKIIAFFANKQITQKNAAGAAYEINPEARTKYSLLRSAEGSADLMAALDYGSYSMSEDMRVAMSEYWTKYRFFKVKDGKGGFAFKTIFEIMDDRPDGRAVIEKEIGPTGKDKAVKRDIDPAFVQIITPLVNVLQRIKLPARISPAKELAKIKDRVRLHEILSKDAVAVFESLPEEERFAIASAVNPREKEARVRGSIADAAKYLEANEPVMETIQFFLLFRDRASIFGDLDKVVGSADLGEDSIWPAYKRLLDMGNEKFQMLNDITGKVEQIELSGKISSVDATDIDKERAGCVRRAQGIKDSAAAKFGFAGKDFALSVKEVAQGIFLSTKGDRFEGQKGLEAYTNSPESGIWIKGSLLLGNNTLLPGSSVVNSVIHNSEGRINCENFYVESSSVLSLSGEDNAPARAGMAIKIIDDNAEGVIVPVEKPIAVDIYHPQLGLPGNHARFFVRANHDPEGQKVTDWQGSVIKTVESDAQTMDVTNSYNLKQIRETFEWSSTANAKIADGLRALTHSRIAEIDELYATAKALGFGTSGLRADDTLMTDREVYINTLAFMNYMLEEGRKGVPGGMKPGSTVDVAGDFRPSTPRIVKAVIAAIIDSGCVPNFCGNIPTPALTLYGMANDRPSIMVTASHNPYDFKAGHGDNGIKFNRSNGEILKLEEAAIFRHVAKARWAVYSKGAGASLFTKEGAFKAVNERAEAAIRKVDEKPRLDYIERYKKAFGKVFGGLEIVFYQHTTVGRDILPQIFQELGANVYAAGRLDEHKTFKALDTEDISQGVLDDVRHLAWEHIQKYNRIPFAILSADGDSDRPAMFFVKNELSQIQKEEDVQIEYLPGDKLDVLACLFLKPDFIAVPKTANDMALKRLSNPKEKGGLGANVLLTEVGSPHIVKAMIDNRDGTSRRVGFEVNGGLLTDQGVDISELLMERFGGVRQGGVLPKLPTRDAALPLISALLMANETGSVNELTADTFGGEYAGFVHSGLVEDKDKKVNSVFGRYTKEAGLGIVKAITPDSPSPDNKITEVDFTNGTVTYENQKTKEITQASLKDDKNLAGRMKTIEAAIKMYLSDERFFGKIAKIIYFSGVKIYFDNGNIVTLRPSGNAPQFRVQPICSTQQRADQVFGMRFDIVGEMLGDYLDGTLGVKRPAASVPIAASPGIYAVSAEFISNNVVESIFENHRTGKEIVNVLFKGKNEDGYLPALAGLANSLNIRYAEMTPEEREAAWPALERFYAAMSERALSVKNIETARGLQIMTGQTIAVQNLIENGVHGAKEIQITANPAQMLRSADNEGRDRGLSYIAIPKTMKIAEKEGGDGIYWRGAEGFTKLGRNRENYLAQAAYTENDTKLDRLVMYTMLHVNGLHTTVFLHTRLPGSVQHVSTGRGHPQNGKLDIKRVARGEMAQFSDIYDINGERVNAFVQRVKKGEFTLSIPGSVDYVSPIRPITVFNDVSVDITDNPGLIFGLNPNMKARDAGKITGEVTAGNLQAIEHLVTHEKPAQVSYAVVNYEGRLVLAQVSQNAPEANQIAPYPDLFEVLGFDNFRQLAEAMSGGSAIAPTIHNLVDRLTLRPARAPKDAILNVVDKQKITESARKVQVLYENYLEAGRPFRVVPLIRAYPWGVSVTATHNYIMENLGLVGNLAGLNELIKGTGVQINETDNIGESWLGKGAIALEIEGEEKYLPVEVLSLFGEDVYGDKHVEEHAPLSGITAKILQASTDLSWQIHLGFAEKVTALEDTTVYVALEKTMPKDEFIKAVKEGRTDIFHEITIKAGETLVVPAKCPHAYKAGSVVVEFKDIDTDSPAETYSFYDRGRLTPEQREIVSESVRNANYNTGAARAAIGAAHPEIMNLIRDNKDGLTTSEKTLEKIASEIENAGFLNAINPESLMLKEPILLTDKSRKEKARAEIIGITEGSVGLKYTVKTGQKLDADQFSLGSGQPLTVLEGKAKVTTESGKEETIEKGGQYIIPHNAKGYALEAVEGETVVVTAYKPLEAETLVNLGFEAIRANLPAVRTNKVHLLTTTKAFRKGDVQQPGTFRYEQGILSRVSDGKVELSEVVSRDAAELKTALQGLMGGEEGVSYVIQLTEDEFSSIKDDAEVAKMLKDIRMMILPNVKFADTRGIPFIREIESAGVILGNTKPEDIRDKTAIAGWLKLVMSKLTGNKAIDWETLATLLKAPDPSMSFSDRINILLKHLAVRIQPHKADEGVRERRQLLWSV